ncbi:hydrolethalus syndrome protein 1 homolog [Gigantopelta aegis]|uniref:hydrolethalus syndrome protein 1 homolog n=1 Tax=Gigantopelta aegis TaxID=1735272 RepID=UPI001B88CE21|nr:hydrolethalus syndrome protein 1 homolog [Gigantopelta aegis]XP_041351379.1 hydrolethalus syndrome protein 1 homolog [Gigantopelta aegis]
MESIDFTEAEIQEELARLGYQNVPEEKLRDFKRDLHRLIEQEKSKDSSLNTCPSSSERSQRTELSGGFRDPVLRERVRADERHTELEERYNGYDKYGKENRLTARQEPDLARMSLPKGLVYTGGQYSLYDGVDPRQPSHELQDDISECGSERRMVKRKVLRKTDKGSKFVDESMTESEAGSIADANECLQRLGLGDASDLDLLRRPKSSKDYAPYRLSPNDPRPSSVILRPAEHPHIRNLRKCDPVARFQQFQQVWQTHKTPGEKDHKDLRWNIRAQMLTQDTFEKKPQKVFVPNNYQVPTEKKRSSLRWQIRTDIAQGNMPPCGFFCEY